MPNRAADVAVVVQKTPFSEGTEEALVYPFDWSTFQCPGFCTDTLPPLFKDSDFSPDTGIIIPISKPDHSKEIGFAVLMAGLGLLSMGIAYIPRPQPQPVTGECVVLTRVRGKSYRRGQLVYKALYHLRRLTQLLSVRQYLSRRKELSPEELWEIHHNQSR